MPLGSAPVTVGRAPDSGVSLPDDPRVSRKHAQISVAEGQVLLTDLGSSNGTTVDGVPVSGTVPVEAGSRIQVGDAEIRVERQAPRSGAPGPRRGRSRSLAAPALAAAVLAAGAILLVWSPWRDRPAGGGTNRVPAAARLQIPDAPAAPREAPQPGRTDEAADEGRLPAFEADAAREREFELALMEGRYQTAAALARGVRDQEFQRQWNERIDAMLAAEAARLRDRAESLARSGRTAQALDILQERIREFPARSEARTSLAETILGLRVPPPRGREVAAAPAPPRPPEGGAEPGTAPAPRPRPAAKPAPALSEDRAAALDELLARAEGHLARWRPGEAIDGFREALESLSPERSILRWERADRGLRTAAACERFIEAIQRAAEGRAAAVGKIPATDNRPRNLLRIDGEGLAFSGEGNSVLRASWEELPLKTLSALIERIPLDAGDLVDAALALAHKGATDVDGVLARAASRDAGLKPRIDQVIAQIREFPEVPEGGFTLLDGRFLSPTEMARRDLEAEIAAQIAALDAKEAEVRDGARTALLMLGDAALHRYHSALRELHARRLSEIRKNPAFAKLQEIAERHGEYRQARANALALIFDTEKYPYPYRVPEATPEAAANYQRSQPEVERLTTLVQRAYGEPKSVRLAEPFRDLVARLREVRSWLDQVPELLVDPEPQWLIHLPAEETVTVRNLAEDEADRLRIDASLRTMAENENSPGVASRTEQEQCRITNEYRVMMGRHAVRLYDRMTLAAHDHCNDMSTLGFFSHMSPVEGKRTPWDRMARQGMQPLGASENIAINRSPLGAHQAWLRSPGHHRNLLGSAWRLMGPGHVGRYYCQKFSTGDSARRSDSGNN